MIVHHEDLYHFACDHCKGHWAIADRKPEIGVSMLCPYPTCQKISIVETVESHPMKPIISELKEDENSST